ncbi:MAG TPA: enoyl-CoA hydratase-related protein, partial [Candidatus Cybelea sp.]|nr:enoyl-CoA hydratase-related protein [Candidatus Cybelea sp.]
GDAIDAQTALAWGLVNRVVAPEQLHDETVALAKRIVSASRGIVALGKASFYAQIDLDQARAYDYTKAVMTSNALEPDAAEGITAFLERRKPTWEA